MKKKYYVAILVVLSAVAFAFWSSKKMAVTVVPQSSDSKAYVPPQELPPLPQKATSVPIPTHGATLGNETKGLPSGAPDKILESRAGELNMFEKVNTENKKRIFAQMKAEEISSLKDSIANDEMLLKKIEKNGTGIEDYKFIQKNLEKRKKRLQALSK